MRIREIDGLRAIAALAVVATHYFAWVRFSGAQYGWLGVDLFFVISGFLITSILIDLKSNSTYFKTFYARRAFRIFPPYFFVLTIYLVYSLAIHRAGTVGLWTQYVFYYASLLFSRTEYNISLVVSLGLTVLWSLSVEELFYLLWAPAVRFIDGKRFWALLTGIVIAAPIFRWALHYHAGTEVFTFYCRMDGLAFGSMIALIVHAHQNGSAKLIAADRIFDRACLGLGILFLAFFAAAGSDYKNPRIFVLGVTLADLFFASLVYYIVRHSGESSLPLRLFRLRPLRSIGMISYSLYLVHYPLLIVARNICANFHLGRRLNAVSIDAVGISLTLLVAYSMWYGFESYSLRLKDRMFPSPAKVAKLSSALPSHAQFRQGIPASAVEHSDCAITG
jgi:peptidoglycan/LPS O-acetylase OafA/YrhL